MKNDVNVDGTSASTYPKASLDNSGWLGIEEREIHSRYRELDARIYPLILEVLGDILTK